MTERVIRQSADRRRYAYGERRRQHELHGQAGVGGGGKRATEKLIHL